MMGTLTYVTVIAGRDTVEQRRERLRKPDGSRKPGEDSDDCNTEGLLHDQPHELKSPAPRAARTPSSRVRCDTEYDSTPNNPTPVTTSARAAKLAMRTA
jgi:hypothetical protein